MASVQPYEDEQLNYFKFASIVLNEFPRALRQTFRSMWDNNFGHLPGFQTWDDSVVVRKMFLNTEGGTTKVPTHLPYDGWDCTALFQATIYARSFALPDSKGHHRTLNDLYVKPCKLTRGSFHVSVVSPGGNNAETFALAIDQLRLLRNSLCHSSSSEIDKTTFDRYVRHAKDAFKALGIKTDLIDAIGSLNETDFPTKEVRKLQQGIKEETRGYIKFLQGVSSDIQELRALSTSIKGKVEVTASKQDIATMFEEKISDLKMGLAKDEQDTKPSLPKTCLPPMVPHFTGRKRECDEITSHVISKSTRIVSIWGSPGFGKTSVATAVGHRLHSEGLPVYFLSLRGVKSKTDLTSKLLSFFRNPAKNYQPSQPLSLDDELFQLLSEISDHLVLILDNADELLESGVPGAKQDFIIFVEDILTRSKMVTVVITTRESLEFMNVRFQGHQAVRIRPLDESSSQSLVHELLQNVKPSDCKRITQSCGRVPLAMKLMCSVISEDDVQPSQVLDYFMESLESNNIVEMLDKPDYPSNLRLKLLFDSSFRRLSAQEKEALVSLSVLPESFDLTVAAAVLGISQIPLVKKILHGLRRKSLLDSSSKPGSFSIHKLVESFARERGEHEMKETILNSKSRLCAFYVSRFEKLNEEFLTGNSMKAFVEFYEDEQSIVQSLIEGCKDPKLASSVFEILVKAELFLYSLYWRERANFYKIYDSAMKIAEELKENVFHRQLLISRAFYEITWVKGGTAMRQLFEAKELHAFPVSDVENGKHWCYSGFCQLVTGNTEDGVQYLEEALPLMNDTPEQRILRIVTCQILAAYYRFVENSSRMSMFFSNAVEECRATGSTELLIIPAVKSTEKEIAVKEMTKQPLQFAIICLVSESTKHFSDTDIEQIISNAAQQIVKDIEKPLFPRSLGLLIFQHNVNFAQKHALTKVKGAAKISEVGTSSHEAVIIEKTKVSSQPTTLTPFTKRCGRRLRSIPDSIPPFGNERYSRPSVEQLQCTPGIRKEPLTHSRADVSYDSPRVKRYGQCHLPSAIHYFQQAPVFRRNLFGEERSRTADSYHLLGVSQHANGDFTSAIESTQRALYIRRKLFGEEHPGTADSYHSLGVSQHANGDFALAIQSTQRALDIRRKLFGEEHTSTADSYRELGFTQHSLGDFTSAIQSKQHALEISRKLFGEEHSSTADSYHALGVTQHSLGDFTSAIQSTQRALDIRHKIFGEEHSSTADSYHSLGVSQHANGDFTSAIQAEQRALDIRRKLFGEEHSSTADSYHSLCATQHTLGDFTSAIQSAQRALVIRRKLFGDEHSCTADSYHSLAVTQSEQGDFTSAIQSTQRALDIRRKVLGDEHSCTADSYHSLAVTQSEQGDLTSAVQSTQRALDIRRKLFGEEHSSTADSYYSLGDTQHSLGDFASAIQSTQRALDIRHKLFGEEHSRTADSYHSLGVSQHSNGDFTSAIESTQRALYIRLKLFGEEHSSTADCYHLLGVIQHALFDFTSAIQSKQRALEIRRKLFGEEHSSTADSYHSLAVTQNSLGDFTSDIQSTQRALDIRRKLFGEEHSSTADSYYSLGDTQHSLGDFASAIQSTQRALDIRHKLFGEEHSRTADSYHSLGVSQHASGDFTSAIESTQRALYIRLKLFGEEHSSTADSYHLLGVIQHALFDFTSAIQSKQRALEVRRKLFGEEHASTADSYYALGVTQHSLGDFTSAIQSKQRALEIRRKLLGEEYPETK